jgi:acyl-coenzyme A thioesterase PaaI-like protein
MTDPIAIDPEDRAKVPPGWSHFSTKDTFSGHAGPFWFRDDGTKTPGVGFVSRKIHTNFHGVIHGGALMTLADMALFNICFHAIGRFQGVTLSTTVDFIAAGPVGEFIEATGEATKASGSVLFARGRILAKGATLATFSGSLKRIK